MKRLRRLWFRLFASSSQTVERGTSRTVEDDETVARFAVQRKRALKQGSVHYALLMPHAGETSVFRIDELDEGAIWALGREIVARPRGKTLRGRADLLVEHVRRRRLRVESDPSSHPRHAVIVDCRMRRTPR